MRSSSSDPASCSAVPPTSARTRRPTNGRRPSDLAAVHPRRQGAGHVDHLVLDGDDLGEAVDRVGDDPQDVGEDPGQDAEPVRLVVDDGAVDVDGVAAVLDLLDEVPEEQRGDPVVARGVERLVVVEEELEDRRERRLEVGGVGEVELHRLRLQQLVERGDRLVQRLLDTRVPADQRLDVEAVHPRVLALLAREGVGLLAHVRVGDQRHRVLHHRQDEPLERDREHADRVADHRELGVLRVPDERHVVVEVERDLADLQVGHRALPMHVLAASPGWRAT